MALTGTHSAIYLTQVLQALASLGIFTTALVHLVRMRREFPTPAVRPDPNLVSMSEQAARRDLRWQRSRNAHELLKEMETDERCAEALGVLRQGSRRLFSASPVCTVSLREIDSAFAAPPDTLGKREALIVDRISSLFWYLGRLEANIQAGLISDDDIRFPIGQIATEVRACGDVLQVRMREMGFGAALTLIERLGSPAPEFPC